MNVAERTTCRACQSPRLDSILNLGTQPLANRLVAEADLEGPELRFPLHLVACQICKHFQLAHTVDPEILYHDYPYQSGHSEGWHRHSEALALEIAREYPGGTVLDVAANDCTLLSWCRANGLGVTGVEPARNLPDKGVPVLREFFSVATAASLSRSSVVVAQNVFGHVDDPRGFLEGVALALQTGGVAIIECPWVVDLLRYCRWDTIYHEHLSYWGINALQRVAKEVGLWISNVKYYPDLHGGTARYYLRHGPGGGSNSAYLMSRLETEIPFVGGISLFQDVVPRVINHWADYFKKNTKVIAGYGASAKSSTFLNAMPERPPLVGIFDDSPQKQGRYTPGHHFPVLVPTETCISEAEELINFAPNWPLEDRARELGFTGEVKPIW